MIQTQSQKEEIRKIEKIAWRKDRDKVRTEVRWKVRAEFWGEAWWKVRDKAWRKVWSEVMHEGRIKKCEKNLIK
jgi:hypothetical protein